MAAKMVEGSKESRVMVVIDENESSYCYALKWAFQNLQESVIKSSNALILFMVLPPTTDGGGGGNFFSVSPRIISGTASFATSISDKAKSICVSRGIDAETITVVGGSKEAICEGVKKYKINLLILGDHTTGKFKRTFLGSVSNYCVSNAKCPVLVVKSPT